MISAPFVDVWSHGICKITKNTPLTLFDFLPLEKALGFAWLFSVSGVTCHGKPAQGSYMFRTGKSSGNQSSQGTGGGWLGKQLRQALKGAWEGGAAGRQAFCWQMQKDLGWMLHFREKGQKTITFAKRAQTLTLQKSSAADPQEGAWPLKLSGSLKCFWSQISSLLPA